MTEEKKGFSIFKLLIILWILAGLGGTALFFVQKDKNQNWGSYLKEASQSLKRKVDTLTSDKKKIRPIPSAPVQKIDSPKVTAEVLPEIKEIPEIDTPTIEEQVGEILENQPEQITEVLPVEENNVEIEETDLEENIPTDLFEQTEEVIAEVQPEELTMAEENEENLSIFPSAEEIVPVEQPIKNRFSTTYTWKDFQSGKACLPSEIFDEENKEISNILYSYCKSPDMDAWQKWQATFREGKRSYFIQKTLKEKTKYIKYLKLIPHLLFDVYKTNATGTSLNDQLDKIETLIAKRQTKKALELLKNISDEAARLALNPAIMEGNHLIAIQNFLNNHSSEGGEND